MRTKIFAVAEARSLALAAGADKSEVDRMVKRLMASPEGLAEADIICFDLDPDYGPPDLVSAGLVGEDGSEVPDLIPDGLMDQLRKSL